MRYEFRESNEVLDIIRVKDGYKYTIRIFKTYVNYIALIVEKLDRRGYKPVKVLYGRFDHDKIIMMLNEDGYEKTFTKIYLELTKQKARK